MIPAVHEIAKGISQEAESASIAKRLEDLRWQLRLEWNQLARRIGVSRISIYKWRKGEMRPSSANLELMQQLEAEAARSAAPVAPHNETPKGPTA